MKNGIVFLKAMADETRMKMLEFLLGGEKCVCEIFPHVGRTQSTVSVQLSLLEKAGIVKPRREGKKVFYSIADRRVCDMFKALGNPKGKILKRSCCMGGRK
ncbi:MAG: metalloregulator ArsR/SmtB family transcription factor [Candidatus Aenigmatarchaeota archaeon]